MRIGELAAAADVSVRALRYYEEQQLIYSVRSSGGQRQYAEAVAERVRLIQLLYRAGLTSKVIRSLLPCMDAQVSTPESRAVLAGERERIDAQIGELVEARDRLDAIIAMTRDPVVCSYAEAAPAR